MKGSVLGSFRIVSELGSGGMGTVYAATVEEEFLRLTVGDRVAIKVIHSHLLGRRGFFKRFLREGDVGRQVSHRNVVRTFDVDALEMEGETIHFLVMEYVEGRTLRELLNQSQRLPEALVREIAVQVAAGLAAIHEAGIVHRDLKPENILITDDHQIRIMDLGIARLIDETAVLTQEGQFAGSLLYAPPEQIQARSVGPAADLYSLGVLLYELAAGHHPFRSGDAASIINEHLRTVPVRLDLDRPEVSPFFAQVVATLLEKEPDRRFASAEHLAEALRGGERSDWWGRQEQTVVRELSRLPAIPVRRTSAFLGRTEELEHLRTAWREATESGGHLLVMEGEAGIGKTRLVDAFVQDMGTTGATVLYGSYPPSGGLGALSDAVLDHFGAADIEQSIRPYLTVTPKLATAFGAMIQHIAPPADVEELKGEALHSVFVQLMRGLAGEGPLLWIIEDLHFAEPDSLSLILSLARALDDRPVLLLATARPGLPESEMSYFSRLPRFRRLSLGRLGPREVIELLKDAFRSTELAEKLGGKIAYKSDGVPFFIFEMIRGLLESEHLRQLPDGSCVETRVIDEIEVPSSVRDLIEARLRGLSSEERSMLDVGAVEGFEFDPDLIARVRRLGRIPVLETLADIERKSGVIRGSGMLFRFDHHQIQEVLYEQLHRALRQDYHQALADALADREGVTGSAPALSGETALFLVSHRLKGSQPCAAAPDLELALASLHEAARTEAAASLARGALAQEGLLEGKQRFKVLQELADDLGMLGRKGDQQVALDEMLELASRLGEADAIAAAEKVIAMHFLSVGELTAAQEHIERAVDTARNAGLDEILSVSMDNLGSVLRVRGELHEACARHESAIAIARRAGSRASEASAEANFSIALREMGRIDEALQATDRSSVIAQEVGLRSLEGAIPGQKALIFLSQGRHEEAKACVEEYLAFCRESGNRRGEAFATGNLGGILLGFGHYEVARQKFERHLGLARELGDRHSEAIAHVNLGYVSVSLGNAGEARQNLETAREIAKEIGDPRVSSYALHGLGVLAANSGEPEESILLLEQSLEIRREISYAKGVAETLLALGRLNAEATRTERSRQQFEEALRLGRDLDAPDVIVLAVCHLASSVEEASEALELLEKHGPRLGRSTTMEARFRLWLATGEVSHLDRADRELTHLVEHAPESCRRSIIEGVPLHRDIRAALEER